jgi:hypothetical protein
MKDANVILANDRNGNDITIKQVEEWLQKSAKKELTDFFYDRFYGRYLKPFNYNDPVYTSKFKNGFAIMTSCCLLIETFVSFIEPTFRDTNYKSERCFGYFFLINSEFNAFSKDGLTIDQYKNFTSNLNNKGVPHDFYKYLRCGLLHNGETRNGWKITRAGPFFDELNKRINAVKFMDKLINVINGFRDRLIKSDFDNDEIWKTYKDRLQDLIDNS